MQSTSITACVYIYLYLFTGLYTRWDSFAPPDQKVNLIKSLTSRAIKICSPDTLYDEVATLTRLFVDNGYPTHLVDRMIRITLKKGVVLGTRVDDRHHVSLRLPWIGSKSVEFGKTIRGAIRSGFPPTSARVVFTTQHAFSGRGKDVLPH